MSDSLLDSLVLGRYRVVRALAMGGMGVIYLGRGEGAAGFTKPVVIKRIVPDYTSVDADAQGFFIREAAILAQLRDPGIVGVLDFGEEAGAYTMVLEYVHGFTLGQWDGYHRRVGKKFSAPLAIHIVSRMLQALESAHMLKDGNGVTTCVVHRDLTPSNVLIDVTGVVKLADFGIARVSQGVPERTASGLLRGKMPYLAPELLDGYAASVASDVYSAGVMLHSLLVGDNEWNGATPAETLRLVLEHVASSVEAARDDAPKGIDAVLARALARDPSQRFASASEFADALRALPLPNPDELARDLAARVREEFPEQVPKVLGLPPLATLESAWRESRDSVAGTVPAATSVAPASIPDDGRTVKQKRRREPEAELSAPPTDPTVDAVLPEPLHEVASVTEVSPLAPPKESSSLGTTALFVLALALAGLAVWLALRPTGTPARAPSVVVVEAEPWGLDVGPASVDAITDAGITAPTEVRDAAIATRTPGTPPARGGSLERAFRAQSGPIRECFTANWPGDARTATATLRIRVGANGGVERVGVAPAPIASSALGRCVATAARRMRFEDRYAGVEFSIPVTVQRGAN